MAPTWFDTPIFWFAAGLGAMKLIAVVYSIIKMKLINWPTTVAGRLLLVDLLSTAIAIAALALIVVGIYKLV